MHMKMVCSVWCAECYHKINCEPMGTEIQGQMCCLHQQNRYEKCLTRYGDYVEK